MNRQSAEKPLLCPSAQPDLADAQIFGVQIGTSESDLRVGYLTEARPVTPDVLASSGAAGPAEVLRIAAPCMGGGCTHFDGAHCQLATRVATMMAPVVSALPRCAIRPSCLWFKQEGPAACVRCPQIVTDRRTGTELQREVAGVTIPVLPRAADAP
jgi:hypothetical protein